jgi:hypothetical protein
MKMKIQVLPEFYIIQHSRDIIVLHKIKKYFNCGVVKRNNGDIMSYNVRNLKHLNEIIIPFFSKNMLLTSKKFNFIKFR